MTADLNTWQGVRGEVLRRLNSRVWEPGDLLPTEAALAAEFGCARTTVNRALRDLASSGLLDRRRKAGTRVALNPTRHPVLRIPVIRQEIEGRGHAYGYALRSRRMAVPPAGMRARLDVEPGVPLLHLTALHHADGKPYMYEDRWINTALLPAALAVDFDVLGANEWLVANVPFSGGDFRFMATGASRAEAEMLACAPGEALFVIDRTTHGDHGSATTARLTFAPGYRMSAQI